MNYTKITDFAAKDDLTHGDTSKIVKGKEIGAEYDNIATAIATKADSAGPTFTGTVVLPATTSVGTVTAAEVAYLSGVTSAIQTQLNTKAPSTSPTLVTPTLGVASATSLTLTNPLAVAQGGTGAATHTAKNLLVGNGTSAFAEIAPGTSGNVLTSNGTDWASSAPSTGHSFSAHKNGSNQSVATVTYTKVTFGTEEFDTSTAFASSTFTPSVAGKYMLYAAVQMALTNNGHNIKIAIYKNGSLYKESIVPPIAAIFATGTATISIVADANGSTDYFEIYAYTNDTSGGTIQGAATATYFTGSRIS